jgi:hypothetical protein
MQNSRPDPSALRQDGYSNIPSLEVMFNGFQTLGNRPEELFKALRQVVQLQQGKNPDEFFPIIAQTVKSSLADVEINKLELLGGLAMIVFDRISKVPGGVKGLYGADALACYQETLGVEVSSREVQQILQTMHAENLILRNGHGKYCVSDPFVRILWEERKSLPSL